MYFLYISTKWDKGKGTERISPRILLYQSIKQGCPLASYLYVFSTDSIGFLLDSSYPQVKIRGISLPDALEMVNRFEIFKYIINHGGVQWVNTCQILDECES